MVTAPFYARTHPAEIEAHFRRIAAACNLPVYAYDLPVSVHAKLPADLLLRLAGEGLLAGVKDSSGDDSGLRRLALAKRDNPLLAGFSVLTGAELTVDTAFRMGADGVVPGLGNVDPDGYARLYKLCVDGDWDAAAAEQERLLRLFDITGVGDQTRMGASSAALGAFKAALHLRGIIGCPVIAPPQIPLNDMEVARIREQLTGAGLL